ncbi:hypothetical protein O2N63_08820 [Aliiroseovarius sp. KMU-50]|uniref:Uncharacterized protein n=1 Tax=Aliiroseovarius salicola TaxID=3009082 RepID=A0ABT4W111_9RHOB|nr:hypothetical protein [Aliiroseovarius sp. KMU-50]MDA5094190.1 hypothetical protein [Aliiroseovarius sp. KMU-50]
MDISAPSPISAQATLAAHATTRDASEVAKIDPPPKLDQTRSDTHTASGERHSASSDTRQMQERREMLRDPQTPAGPPPTFQVTLLEVEQDLQNILARLEANHAQIRNAEAVRAPKALDALTDEDDRSSQALSDETELSMVKQVGITPTDVSAFSGAIPNSGGNRQNITPPPPINVEKPDDDPQ